MALRAVHHGLGMRLMAFAAVDIAMLLHMRVERHIAGGFGELVARHVVARLVQAETLVVLERILGNGVGEVAGHPRGGLGDLVVELRLMAIQAHFALLRVNRRQHRRVAGFIRFHVAVHRLVTDRVAEARLLMPYPKARTRKRDHDDRDNRDDESFAPFLGVSGDIRFAHGPSSPS